MHDYVCSNPTCGKPFSRSKKIYKKPACSRSCAATLSNIGRIKARSFERRNYVCSELDFLIGTDTADSLALRLGYTKLHSLEHALRDWGRHDLLDRLRRTRFGEAEREEAIYRGLLRQYAKAS